MVFFVGNGQNKRHFYLELENSVLSLQTSIFLHWNLVRLLNLFTMNLLELIHYKN